MVGPGQEIRSLHFLSRALSEFYASFYGITISSEIYEIHYHVSEILEFTVLKSSLC